MATIKGTYQFDYPLKIKSGPDKGVLKHLYVYGLTFEAQDDFDKYKESQEKKLGLDGKPVYRTSPNGVPYLYSFRPIGNNPSFSFSTKEGNDRLYADTPAEISSLLDLAKDHEGTTTGDVLSKDAAQAIKTHLVITARRSAQQVGAPKEAVVTDLEGNG